MKPGGNVLREQAKDKELNMFWGQKGAKEAPGTTCCSADCIRRY